MKILEENIKNKNFSNIYVIFGEEEYLKNLYEKKLTDAIVNDELKIMNFHLFEGKAISISQVIDACDTMPFISSHRLVVIKNSGLLFEGKKDDTTTLEKYLHNMTKTTIIIFIEEKIDKKLKICKTINNIGTFHQMNLSSETDLVNWILNVFEENNKNITSKEALYLIRNVSYNMEVLLNEVNKLISFKNTNKITINDIDTICTKSVESKIFELINFIANKNIEKAIQVYQNLIINKTSPFVVLNMISRQFRIILQTKYLYNKNYNISTIVSELGLKDFIVRDAINQSKNFSIKILLQVLEDCLNVDNKIKTGQAIDELAVELLIIKYTTIK